MSTRKPRPFIKDIYKERFIARLQYFEDKHGVHWQFDGPGLQMGRHPYKPKLAAWILFKGPATPGLTVRSTCTWNWCCNPEHLEERPPRRKRPKGRYL